MKLVSSQSYLMSIIHDMLKRWNSLEDEDEGSIFPFCYLLIELLLWTAADRRGKSGDWRRYVYNQRYVCKFGRRRRRSEKLPMNLLQWSLWLKPVHVFFLKLLQKRQKHLQGTWVVALDCSFVCAVNMSSAMSTEHWAALCAVPLLQCNCFHSSYLSIRCYGGGCIGIGPNYHRFVQLGWSMSHYITGCFF